MGEFLDKRKGNTCKVLDPLLTTDKDGLEKDGCVLEKFKVAWDSGEIEDTFQNLIGRAYPSTQHYKHELVLLGERANRVVKLNVSDPFSTFGKRSLILHRSFRAAILLIKMHMTI